VSFFFVAEGVGGMTVTVRESRASGTKAPVEAALRHLGSRRYDDLVELVEYAIKWPDGRTGTILAPFTEATSGLHDWTATERAHAVWRVLEEGIFHPHVSPTVMSRRRRVLQAAFRLPDKDIKEPWGASLTERFKQLGALAVFGNATSTQPMEIAWKRGVERLADHLERELKELRTPEDWARYRPVQADDSGFDESTSFRRPSEGAQKLIVNLHVLTVLMSGRLEVRRVTERVITSQDPAGLKYFRAWAFSSGTSLQGRAYAPTQALWGCRAEQVTENGLPVTQLWFPRPLIAGERAHFLTEVVHEAHEEDGSKGWANVGVDHFGIDRGELRDGLLPVSGLTIRLRFDRNCLPEAIWWYAEQNDRERYAEPPPDSPRRLDVGSGDVVKTFDNLCQPRESYGIAYKWT
jgi:hypothetical protein